MSSQTVNLSLSEREIIGKKVKQLRREGFVPVVIHEKGHDSLHATAVALELTKVYHKVGKHHAVALTVGNTKKLAFIKDVSFEPVKNTISHIAFHAVKQNEKVEAEVPLRMVGQAPASVAGLLVRLNVDHIAVKGLPANIPDVIEIDVSSVATADDDVRAEALMIPEGVEAIDLDSGRVIVSVTVPRAEVEKTPEEEVAAADVPSDNGGEAAAENE
jgi:large subunit ribosomal protein L25